MLLLTDEKSLTKGGKEVKTGRLSVGDFANIVFNDNKRLRLVDLI